MPVLRSKAFACPPTENEQRRKPTPICIRHAPLQRGGRAWNTHLLFRMVKSCEVLKRESQTPVNVFSIYNAYIPLRPWAFCGNMHGKGSKKGWIRMFFHSFFLLFAVFPNPLTPSFSQSRSTVNQDYVKIYTANTSQIRRNILLCIA